LIWDSLGFVEIVNSTFESNFASNGNGGALAIVSGSISYVNSSKFEWDFNFHSFQNQFFHWLAVEKFRKNMAEVGGAIAVIENSHLRVDNCEFLFNSAEYEGGSIYVAHRCQLLISRSVIRWIIMFLVLITDILVLVLDFWIFGSNSTGMYGGGLFLSKLSEAILSETDLLFNQAIVGGLWLFI
jgi:hypothetical protein